MWHSQQPMHTPPHAHHYNDHHQRHHLDLIEPSPSHHQIHSGHHSSRDQYHHRSTNNTIEDVRPHHVSSDIKSNSIGSRSNNGRGACVTTQPPSPPPGAIVVDPPPNSAEMPYPLPPGTEVYLPDRDGIERKYTIHYTCYSMTEQAAKQYIETLGTTAATVTASRFSSSYPPPHSLPQSYHHHTQPPDERHPDQHQRHQEQQNQYHRPASISIQQQNHISTSTSERLTMNPHSTMSSQPRLARVFQDTWA